MLERLAADLVLLIHLGFIVFVVLGGFLTLRWRRLAWIHLPCAAWGTWIELQGGVCPLTPLENRLRATAGGVGYDGGFIEHYLLPLIYPAQLDRTAQVALGLFVLALNLGLYTVMIVRSGSPTLGERDQTEAPDDR